MYWDLAEKRDVMATFTDMAQSRRHGRIAVAACQAARALTKHMVPEEAAVQLRQ